jgi:hypothetical protein
MLTVRKPDQFEKAAELCPKLLDPNVKLWEDWIFFFAEKKHLEVSAPPYLSTFKLYQCCSR